MEIWCSWPWINIEIWMYGEVGLGEIWRYGEASLGEILRCGLGGLDILRYGCMVEPAWERS